MGLLFWLVVAPLIAGLIILVMPATLRSGFKAIAFLGILASLVMTLVLWEQFDYGNDAMQLLSKTTWFTLPNVWAGQDATVYLSFGVDGLSLALLTLATVVSLLAVISRKPNCHKAFFFWLSVAASGAFTVFTAQDLVVFFIGLEMILFSMFFLIYMFGGERRTQAAFKFLIYRGLASVGILVAFIGLAYGAVGVFHDPNFTSNAAQVAFSTDIPTIMQNVQHLDTTAFSEGFRSALFLVLLLAVFIEEGFVPLHTWLPTAHEESDTATNVLLGGVLTKTGAFILLKFGVGILPGEVSRWGTLIAVLGVINILYGAFAAWAQRDWRRLIAFGSISHMGIYLLGIAAMNSAGLQGAMFMIVSSGLLSALLFFITGAIKERTHTVQIPALGGLSKSLPMLSGFLLFAALGSLGLPLTSGFISEIQAFIGGFGSFPTASTFGVIGMILSACYLLYAMQKTTFGQIRAEFAGLVDAKPLEYIPMILLTGLVLLVGIYPSVIGDLFGLSIHALLRIGG